ncbi:IS110 family RNA-guided transposase [Paenibacillus antibioticophila]|uniref:IS110 family transposase n=2 Tax=Paenibacillus antibioticophila TaxID=1274374 RepID=UPI0005CADA20|nr:IS110 family transposase [Paenibacillus antibioticophila]
MKNTTKYVGMDVSKDKIAVAIADEGREAPRFYGTIAHNPDAVAKLIRKLQEKDVVLEVCYEAGPTGYDLYHWITRMGVSCAVIAPSRIPVRAGDSIKTDRRDAERLAQLHRAGELTPIHVPTRETEALRDLVRAREDVKEDLHRARQRIIHFLLRHHIHPPASMKRRWTKMYRQWLATLTFERKVEQTVFDEYLQQLREIEERIKRLETAMQEAAEICTHAPVIRAIQGLRGVALLTAITLVVEIENFERFRSPAQLMSYLGLVPREQSSGITTKRGRLTKTGNSRVRRALIEAAWSYRHRPAVKGDLEKRLEGQSAHTQEVSWKAQHRLHSKYLRLLRKGKHKNLVVAAIGRELVGFIWSIAVSVERSAQHQVA